MRTKHGAYLAMEPTSLDVYAYMLNHGGVWDERVFEVCSAMLSEGSVFYDIGANVGYMSIEIAARHRENVTVVSFEPQPALARAVARSAQLNGLTNVSVFEVLVGAREGEADLFLTSHSLHASMVPRERGARRLPRSVATIDGMVRSGRIPPPDVMKLDVEGAEVEVLSGAMETISARRPSLIFEANENMARFGHTVRDLVELVGSAAPYDFFVLVRGANDLVPIGAWSGRDRDIDILAVPRGEDRGRDRGRRCWPGSAPIAATR
jgi:FkbM family methyltransferase